MQGKKINFQSHIPRIARGWKTEDTFLRLKYYFFSYAIQDAAGGNRQSVLVPKDAVGFVIGKGGETIKDLMHRSGAHIEVDRSEGATTAPMRAFFVTGTAAQIENARSLIHEKVAGVLHSKAEAAAAAENLMGATNIEIWVPMDRVGMIIGSGGQVIKQLQEKSGATIVVHNDRVSQSGEKLVTIVGGPSESEVARNLVHEIMTKPKPQGSQQQQASTQQQQQVLKLNGAPSYTEGCLQPPH